MTERRQARSVPGMPLPRLDLNLLQVFDAVMTERHVTRAAVRLEMTQPAVSNALKRLRRQFEDQLFVKAARGVDPTPRAGALWPGIHQALEDLRNTVLPQNFDARSTHQRYRIAMVDITAALLSAHLYRSVHARAPGTNLFLIPHDPALTGPRLMRGELDFALVIEPPRASVVQSMPLWSDNFVVAARRGHALLEGKLSLAAFCAAAHLAINWSGAEEAPSPIDDALAQRGLTRNIGLSVNQYSVVTTILSATDLIAVLPARFAAAAPRQGEIATRPLPFSLPDAVVHLCWHQRSVDVPAQQWLKQRLLEAATALSLQTDRQAPRR